MDMSSKMKAGGSHAQKIRVFWTYDKSEGEK